MAPLGPVTMDLLSPRWAAYVQAIGAITVNCCSINSGRERGYSNTSYSVSWYNFGDVNQMCAKNDSI